MKEYQNNFKFRLAIIVISLFGLFAFTIASENQISEEGVCPHKIEQYETIDENGKIFANEMLCQSICKHKCISHN